MRGLTGLLAGLLIAATALASPPAAAACTGCSTPFAQVIPHAASTDVARIVSVPTQGLPDTATEPPGADDPNRPHLDPGAWPLLVFIVALFVFGLVLRGSRVRPEPLNPADRRRR